MAVAELQRVSIAALQQLLMSPPFTQWFNKEMSALCTRLWDLDKNRLVPGRDYEINLQGVTDTRSKEDVAARRLFKYVYEDSLQKPTYQSFIQLLDNYERFRGKEEEWTDKELEETKRFLDEIMKTEVMQEVHTFLVSKGEPRDENEFKQRLFDIWFKFYRSKKNFDFPDSSGFEHVFVGEAKGRKVTGFHNWIQFYQLERDGSLNYHGVIEGTEPYEGKKSHLLTMQFTWENEIKPIGGGFIGVSPEFEMALYTACFLYGDTNGNGSGTETFMDVEGLGTFSVVTYKHREFPEQPATSYPKIYFP